MSNLIQKVMNVFYIIIFSILFSCNARKILEKKTGCLSEWDKVTGKEVFGFVDEMPFYPNGSQGIIKFFSENYNHANPSNFIGSFIIEYVIDIDGSVKGPRIKDKKTQDLSKSEIEVLKVFGKMQSWKAGKCNGTIVPVKLLHKNRTLELKEF